MIVRWFMSVNHKDISVLYVILGVAAGVLGSIISWMLRFEMSVGSNNFVFNNNFFNVMTTAHALVIIFFFLMPVLISSFSNVLLPLYCAVPDMAFPRMNNLSYWLITPALVMVLISSVIEGSAGCGWTVYPPLSSLLGHPGGCVDCVIFALHLASASSIMGSINFISTVMVFSSVGYELSVFGWAFYVTVFLLVLSLPVLAAGITMLLFDRNVSSGFFVESDGGDSVLFQHLFWFFGHPEVYVLILPAFGILAQVVIYYVGDSEVGSYYGMVWAIASIGIVGCVVWAHHMFTVGMDVDTRNYFTAATMIISVPTGINIFSWVSILVGRYVIIESAIVWVFGFIWLFTLSSVTSITLSNNSMDLVIHDTYFVVAHFHYVLSMAATYGICLGFCHWIGIFVYGEVSVSNVLCFFFALFLGVNLIFFPIHEMGLSGLPRRYFSYVDCLVVLNLISGIGVLFSMIAWINLYCLLLVGMRGIGGGNLGVSLDGAYGGVMPLHTYI